MKNDPSFSFPEVDRKFRSGGKGKFFDDYLFEKLEGSKKDSDQDKDLYFPRELSESAQNKHQIKKLFRFGHPELSKCDD